MGFGRPEWVLNAEEALREKLDRLGVIATIERLNGKAFRYTAGQSMLAYRVDVTPRWTPTPERFREALDALVHLAQANEEVNLAPGSSQ